MRDGESSNYIITSLGFSHEIGALNSVLETSNSLFFFPISYFELDFCHLQLKETWPIPGRNTVSWESWKGTVVGVMKTCPGILSCGGGFEQRFEK